MNDMNLILALSLTVAGTASIYLSSPRQLWRKQALSKTVRCAGLLMLMISLVLLLNLYQVVTALSVWATQCMMLLIVLPYSGALLAIQRERKSHE